MFVKCGECGYLTYAEAPTCNHCGATVGAPPPSEPAPAPAPAVTPPGPLTSAPVPAPTSPPPPPPPGTAPPEFVWSTPPGSPDRSPRWLPIGAVLVLVLVVAIVGVFALASTGDDDSSSADSPTTRAAATPRVANEERLAAAATRAVALPEVGADWTFIGVEPPVPDDPASQYPCLAGARFPIGSSQTTANFTYRLTADNVEQGHLVLTVRVMASAADAEERVALQGDPRYRGCLPAFDDDQYEGTNATGIEHLGIQRLVDDLGVGAVLYRDPLTFTFRGVRQTGQILRGYFAVGRYTATVILSRGGPEAESTLVAVVHSLADRLAAVPTGPSDLS